MSKTKNAEAGGDKPTHVPKGGGAHGAQAPPQPKISLEGGTGRQFSRSVKKNSAVVGPPPENWAPPSENFWVRAWI
jgi:hypothetical protein